jgi:hypothetical protein
MIEQGDLFLVSQDVLNKTELKGDTYHLVFDTMIDENRRGIKYYFHLYDKNGKMSVSFTEYETSELIKTGAWVRCSEDQIAKFMMLHGDYENNRSR